MFDKLPAWAHDMLVIFGGTFLGAVASAVVDAKGVFGVSWNATLMGATDNAFYAAAVTGIALYITPLTKRYGIKSFKKNQ